MVHVHADMLDEAAPGMIVGRALATFGRLDVLVNNPVVPHAGGA